MQTRLIMLLSMIMVCLVASGQIGLVVNSASNDSGSDRFLISEIRKISFGSDSFTIDLNNGQPESIYTFGNVKSLTFEELSSGIVSPLASDNNSRLYYHNGELGSDNMIAEPCKAIVYDLTGRAVIIIDYWDGTPIDATLLNKGVYIFIANNDILKFTK